MTHQATFEEARHAHHYILPPPEGPTVRGECKVCGYARTFPSYEDSTTPDFRRPRQHGKGARRPPDAQQGEKGS